MLRLINIQFPCEDYATADVVDVEQQCRLFTLCITNKYTVRKFLHAMRNGGDELTKLTTIEGEMEKRFRTHCEYIQHRLDLADDYASREY